MGDKRSLASDVNSSAQTPVDSDSILIVPNEDGTTGTLYRAALSGTVFTLQRSSVASADIKSQLLISRHSDQIARLRSAQIYVIISSQSGAGLANTAYENILAPLFSLFSIEAKVHSTTSKTSHREYLADLRPSSEKEDVFVIFGGDTMIYDLLNAIMTSAHFKYSKRITICPIPCGTGNALAMSLGRTSIPIAIGSLFCDMETKTLPLLEITIREGPKARVIWAAVVCSWGLHASLVADSDDLEMRRQYGPKRFGVAAERLLTPIPHVYRGSLRVNNEDLADGHTYLLISHVSHLEPTFPIAPRQSPLQNTLSIIQIGEMDGEGLMGVMKAVYDNSKHIEMEVVKFQEGVQEVEFIVDEREEKYRRICVDGDIITVEQGARIHVEISDTHPISI